MIKACEQCGNTDFEIEVNVRPSWSLSISSTSGGTTDPEPGTYSYMVGTEVSITAIHDTGCRCTGWTGDVPSGHENDNPITITMDSDKTITANFIRQYTLIIATGTGGTTNPTPGTHPCDSGAQVSVTAIPDSGYQFSSWSGDTSGTATTIIIIMDSDKSITASFSEIPSPEQPAPKKGGCFIATAAYGSPLHPHLDILRDFRDRYLITNKPGHVLVNFYYKHSPFVAELIAKHKVLRIAVRIKLLPFVALSYSMVHFGPIITVAILVFMFVLPISLISFSRRKFRQTN